MRKLISLTLTLMLCLSLCSMVSAAEDDFVPSISYKPGPSLVTGKDDGGRTTVGTIRDGDGNVLGYVYDEDCLAITTIAEALDDVQTGIPTEAEELLEQVYQELLNDNMELPYETAEDMAIIHLLDASFLCAGATDGIDHESVIAPEGVCLELTFDLGLGANVGIEVMCYVDGQWVKVEAVNNGDGTVTCLFDKICPIAFAVPTGAVETPKTGDNSTAELGLWIALLTASTTAVAGLVIFRRKLIG